MNDSLQIVGVVVLCFVAAIMISGKTIPELFHDVQSRQMAHPNKNKPTILALDNYFPPDWRGTKESSSTQPTIENLSPLQIARNDNMNSITGSDSASRDDRNGDIIIANNIGKGRYQMASVSQAGAVFLSSEVPYEYLLLVIMMLMIAVIFAHIIFRKKQRIVSRKMGQNRYRVPMRKYYRTLPRYSRPMRYPY